MTKLGRLENGASYIPKYRRFHRIIKLWNILTLKEHVRIKSNSWFHAGPSKNQAMCLRALRLHKFILLCLAQLSKKSASRSAMLICLHTMVQGMLPLFSITLETLRNKLCIAGCIQWAGQVKKIRLRQSFLYTDKFSMAFTACLAHQFATLTPLSRASAGLKVKFLVWKGAPVQQGNMSWATSELLKAYTFKHWAISKVEFSSFVRRRRPGAWIPPLLPELLHFQLKAVLFPTCLWPSLSSCGSTSAATSAFPKFPSFDQGA